MQGKSGNGLGPTVRKLWLSVYHGIRKRFSTNPIRASKTNGEAVCHEILMRNMPEVNGKADLWCWRRTWHTSWVSSAVAHSSGVSEEISFHNTVSTIKCGIMVTSQTLGVYSSVRVCQFCTRWVTCGENIPNPRKSRRKRRKIIIIILIDDLFPYFSSFLMFDRLVELHNFVSEIWAPNSLSLPFYSLV
jgi:hypothetical protein